MVTYLGNVTYTEAIKGVKEGVYELLYPHELRIAEDAGEITLDRTREVWVKMPGTGLTAYLKGETVQEKPKSLLFKADLYVRMFAKPETS